MTKKQKVMLVRIIIAFIIFIPLMVIQKLDLINIPWDFPVGFILYAVPYVIIGWDIIYKAVRNISHGQVFDENFLMCVATFAAFGIGEYSEGVAVMLFYQVGELFQSYAVNRSRQSISDLMDIYPEYANIEEDGQLKQVDPDDVLVGQTIVIKAGERIPLDGKVISGESMIDTSALTGESVPRSVKAGAEVISGCVNGSGVLKVEVTKPFEDSTVTKILEMVENASSKKARTENFITRFAKYYTPIVVAAAVLLAAVQPLLFDIAWAEGIKRACIFLVISCPCALVISVPLSFFGGIGAASKKGVLVKGSNYLEALAEMNVIVFDKTGTLTKGDFKVTGIFPASGSGWTKEELLEMAAYAENFSDHPISRSIKEAYGKKIDTKFTGKAEEISGQGIKAVVGGRTVLAGNEKLMKAMSVDFSTDTDDEINIGTKVYLAADGKFAGSIIISDEVKPESAEALKLLKQSGVAKTVMLTGDKKAVGEAVARELGIDAVYTELLPNDKVQKVEELLENEKGKEKLAFVGDGINDAPVLSRADIGIAMGSMGSDAAIEAADIVLMDDDTSKIASIVKIARRTLAIVKQNIIFALAVKIFFLILGAFGVATMWEAVFADVGVSVIAILNAMRTMRIK